MYAGLNLSIREDKIRINIDSSSRCNLRCPGCRRTKDINAGKQGSIQDMPIEYFKALMRPENNIRRITYNLSLSDPIYSGSFIPQLEYLKSLNRKIKVNISTNASGRNEKWWLKLASLLDPEDHRIEFAIDGLEDTNHLYRVNSKWNTIMLGVKTLRENFKGIMWWRYVIFEHNVHQVVEAKKLAKQLGFNSFRPVVGDSRTPLHLRLKSKTWEEIQNDLSKV